MRRDADGAFSRAMGFAGDVDGEHFRMPGFSTFHRDSNGTITHIASDAYGPGDMYMPVYAFFELLKDGIGDWEPNTPRKQPVTITIPEDLTA